jgi:hypothetical protein
MGIIGSSFAPLKAEGNPTVRKWGVFVILFLLVFVSSSFGASHNILKASAVPEPGILLALSGGLIGLATVVRRHLSE